MLISYLVDLTTEAQPDSPENGEVALGEPSQDRDSNLNDEERGLSYSRRSSNEQSNTDTTRVEETELHTRPNSVNTETSAFVKRKTSQLLNVIRGNQQTEAPLSPRLAELVDAYAASGIAASVRAEIESARNRTGENELPNLAEEDRLRRGRKGATWLMQFRILSGRAFKNLYRNPALLVTHYLSSIVLASEYRSRQLGRRLCIDFLNDSNLWLFLPCSQVGLNRLTFTFERHIVTSFFLFQYRY